MSFFETRVSDSPSEKDIVMLGISGEMKPNSSAQIRHKWMLRTSLFTTCFIRISTSRFLQLLQSMTIIHSRHRQTNQYFFEQFRTHRIPFIWRQVEQHSPLLLLIAHTYLYEQTFTRGYHISLLKADHETARVLLRNRAANKVLQVIRVSVAVFETELHYTYKSMAAALALYQKTLFRRKPAAENIVYLTWHTTKFLSEVLAPQYNFTLIGAVEQGNYIISNDLRKAGHAATPILCGCFDYKP
jgi:hypothetical protein